MTLMTLKVALCSADRARTCDILVNSEALYQLSYRGLSVDYTRQWGENQLYWGQFLIYSRNNGKEMLNGWEIFLQSRFNNDV